MLLGVRVYIQESKHHILAQDLLTRNWKFSTLGLRAEEDGRSGLEKSGVGVL
jgi:hypothetical protein